MATDANLSLTGGTWKRATATTNETPINLRGRTSIRKPLWARIRYYAAANASGANAVTFSMQDQNPVGTYVDKSLALPIDLSTVAKAGVIYLDIVGMANLVSGNSNVRLVATVSGAGGTPVIIYQAEITDTTG